MAEQQSGLRFDIYERVHLPEGLAGIKELEGVELVPHIQVLPDGDQALLRGNLLLTGTYVDEQDALNRSLEHLIPVEITLPMNRVHRMEDISVEIENFDVELLSTRSLNITGVLSLNGLEVVPAFSGDSWQETEEEVVFVHENNGQRPAEEVTFIAESAREPREQRFSQTPPDADAQSLPDTEPASSSEESPLTKERKESWTAEESGSLAAVTGLAPEPETHPTAAEAAAETDDNSVEIATVQANAAGQPAEDDKKEMKIAFGKKTDDSPGEPVGLTTLLQNAVSSKIETRPPEETNVTPEPPIGDKLEWKRLLAAPKHDVQEFKRLRLCIVQKEETLETIAKRYDLNPREIALFNRLGEGELSEGQIVYIPK